MKLKSANSFIEEARKESMVNFCRASDVELLENKFKEYAAQFIDLAVQDLETKYEGEYGIDEIINRVKLIKKQIK